MLRQEKQLKYTAEEPKANNFCYLIAKHFTV